MFEPSLAAHTRAVALQARVVAADGGCADGCGGGRGDAGVAERQRLRWQRQRLRLLLRRLRLRLLCIGVVADDAVRLCG